MLFPSHTSLDESRNLSNLRPAQTWSRHESKSQTARDAADQGAPTRVSGMSQTFHFGCCPLHETLGYSCSFNMFSIRNKQKNMKPTANAYKHNLVRKSLKKLKQTSDFIWTKKLGTITVDLE